MTIGQVIAEIMTGPLMISLVALMAANILLSVMVAIYKGEFSFRKFPDFVPKRIGPLAIYVIVAVLAKIVGEWQGIAILIYAALISLYTTGIIAAIKSLTGWNIPNPLSEKVVKKTQV
ncbi:hypothetical protein ES703_58101 [subsurface metagenome]